MWLVTGVEVNCTDVGEMPLFCLYLRKKNSHFMTTLQLYISKNLKTTFMCEEGPKQREQFYIMTYDIQEDMSSV